MDPITLAALGFGVSTIGSLLKYNSELQTRRAVEYFKQAQQNAQLALIGADTASKRYALLKNEQIKSGRLATASAKSRIGTAGTSSRATLALVMETIRKEENLEFSSLERRTKIAIHKKSSQLAYEKGFDFAGLVANVATHGINALDTYTTSSRNASKSNTSGIRTTVPLGENPTDTNFNAPSENFTDLISDGLPGKGSYA